MNICVSLFSFKFSVGQGENLTVMVTLDKYSGPYQDPQESSSGEQELISSLCGQ